MKYYIDRNTLCKVWVTETYSIEAENYNEAINKLIDATKQHGISVIPDSNTIKLIDSEVLDGEGGEGIEPKDNNGEYTLEIPDIDGNIVYTNV